MTQKSLLKKLRIILPIAVAIFLFAFFPLVTSSASSQTTKVPLTSVRPPSSNSLPASSAQYKACPSSTQCVYVADSIGAVQILQGRTVLSTIPIPLTASDPYSCPVSTYYAYGRILVADPCGNFDAGEIRVLNPANNAWGTPITSAGGEPVFMVRNPMNNFLYVANFDYGTVTVINSKGAVQATITTCGALPEFLDYDASSGLVFVGNRLNFTSDEGCIDVINGLTAGTPITSANGVPFLTVTGVTVNQKTGNVYVNDAEANGFAGAVYEFSRTGTYVATITLPPNTYEPWGSVYSPATKSVYIVSPENVSSSGFSETGFTFAISATNHVSKGYNLGLAPQAGCYNPANKNLYFPNFLDTFNAVSKLNTSDKVRNLFYYGVIEGFGCSAN